MNRRSIIITTIVALSFIWASPAIEAPTAPTPGYLLIENDLAQGENGCQGSVRVQYARLSVDLARGFRTTADSTCAVVVDHLTPTTPIELSLGTWRAEVEAQLHDWPMVWTDLLYAGGCPTIIGGNSETWSGGDDPWTGEGTSTPVEEGSVLCPSRGLYEYFDFVPSCCYALQLVAGGHPNAVQWCVGHFYDQWGNELALSYDCWLMPIDTFIDPESVSSTYLTTVSSGNSASIQVSS